MPQNVNIAKTKTFEDEVESAINLIASITNESVNTLSHMHPDELLELLAYLLKYNKVQIEKLLRRHDQNHSLDFVSLLKLWRLINSGVIKNNKGKNGLEEKVHENIEFKLFRRNEQAAINPTLRLEPASSSVLDSKFNDHSLAKVTINKVGDWRLKTFISNINQFQSIKPASF